MIVKVETVFNPQNAATLQLSRQLSSDPTRYIKQPGLLQSCRWQFYASRDFYWKFFCFSSNPILSKIISCIPATESPSHTSNKTQNKEYGKLNKGTFIDKGILC